MNVSPIPRLLVCGALACAFLALAPGCESDDSLRLLDLNGAVNDPLSAESLPKATVFLFTRTDCPISNRLAPEVHRLYDLFHEQGVAFYLVYPDPDEAPGKIRKHIEDYSYEAVPLRDVRHDLVKRTGALVTPEASVFDSSGKLSYHGRINDRYVDYGKARPAPTTHDLEVAVRCALEGRAPPEPRSKGVGCPIPRL